MLLIKNNSSAKEGYAESIGNEPFYAIAGKEGVDSENLPY